jgi:hypothetical protein
MSSGLPGARCVAMSASELSLPVVAFDDLSSMKKAAGRDQDRVDVRRLERRRTSTQGSES